MQDLIASSLKYQNNTLSVLDQYLLPHQQVWHECDDVASMRDLILSLKIRGAPLIGLGASLLVAHLAEQGTAKVALAQAIDDLEATRPTAVNLMHCMAKLRIALQQDDYVTAIVSAAVTLFNEDIALCESMANHGAALVSSGDNILTHCNTGAHSASPKLPLTPRTSALLRCSISMSAPHAVFTSRVVSGATT